MQNLIYLIIGGLVGSVIFWLVWRPRKQQIKIITNRLVKIEEQLAKISQNEREIADLKAKDKEREEQILLCHQYLSKMTDFRDAANLENHVVASQRFRKHFEPLINKPENYISD